MIISQDGLHIGLMIVPVEVGWSIEYRGSAKWLTRREGYSYEDGIVTVEGAMFVRPGGAEVWSIIELSEGKFTLEHEVITHPREVDAPLTEVESLLSGLKLDGGAGPHRSQPR